jgi:hypothetical protein
MTSIFLRPEDLQERRLQTLIARVAAEHGTVAFPPHLTVCGVPDDHLAALDGAAAYIKRCGLLPMKVAKSAVTGAVITPFRAVFIEVENSPDLQEFREKLREIVGGAPLIPPHISLLYTIDGITQESRTDFDAERLKAIAARCAEAIPDMQFTLARPVVNSAGRDVRGWRVTREL